MRERLKLREKLQKTHNQTFQNEVNCGVRLGNKKNSMTTIDFSGSDFKTAAEDLGRIKFSYEVSKIESDGASRTHNDSALAFHAENLNDVGQHILQPGMKMKFNSPKNYKKNEHIDVLAMPKTQYHGKDFFQRADFRGLLLADY